MAPLTYYFGYLQSTDKLKLYNKLLIKLSETIQKKMDKDSVGNYQYLIYIILFFIIIFNDHYNIIY